jgi:hypothetical protein
VDLRAQEALKYARKAMEEAESRDRIRDSTAKGLVISHSDGRVN